MLPSLWKGEDFFPDLDFRNEIDRLFEDFFAWKRYPRSMWGNGKHFMPPWDVRETDEALIVEAELPGLKPNEFEVKVEEGVLSIGAERKQEKDGKTKGYHRSERYYGRMERKLALPESVEGEKVEAAYKDGVLTITLPKKPSAKSKTVTVEMK